MGLTLILGEVHPMVEVVMVRVLGLPALQPWIVQNPQIGKPLFDDDLPPLKSMLTEMSASS